MSLFSVSQFATNAEFYVSVGSTFTILRDKLRDIFAVEPLYFVICHILTALMFSNDNLQECDLGYIALYLR